MIKLHNSHQGCTMLYFKKTLMIENVHVDLEIHQKHTVIDNYG